MPYRAYFCLDYYYFKNNVVVNSTNYASSPHAKD